MGQDWQVIAFTPREKLGFSGKLGEVLFDGSPSRLVLPLAVPILPKGFGLTRPPDATNSFLTGEHNFGRDEYLQQSDSLSQEEQENISIPRESRIIKRKRDNGPDPTEREQGKRGIPMDKINVSPVIKNTCGLLRLPIELLDVIFQKLSIQHVFVLGLQTRYLWNVARTHIQASRASPCGSWAGKGIICVGEYLEPADYPPNILTESEKEELQKGLDESEIWDGVSSDEGSTDFVSSPTNFYSLADARYQRVREWQDWLVDILIGGASELGEWHRLPPSRRALIFDELPRYELSDFYPEDQPWILRNLTTQEYVRSEAIAIKPEYIHGPNIDVFGFGEVVWSRVCWSTEPDCSMDYTDNLHRGVWAGHRFDITTLDRHKQDSLERAEWKDVSKEVANEVERIWRKEFGSNWRDIIQERR